jgi:hypothetical protein
MYGDSPGTVIDPEADVKTVAVTPPGDAVAVYEVIAAPPLSAGAVYVTDAVFLLT